MAVIQQRKSGRTRLLEPEHVFGRLGPPTCTQTLEDPYASSVHAVLRWGGSAWELKDLNSTNGTFLDGQRVRDNTPVFVHKGQRIGFGKCDDEWEIVDSRPPAVMAVPLDGGDGLLVEEELIALPSDDDPQATIHRTHEGWVLERVDEPPMPLHDAKTFEVAGRLWRFHCPDAAPATLAANRRQKAFVAVEVERLHLFFGVSLDEEHVEVHASDGHQRIDLGDRACNYLLLTLARQRVKDAKEGLPESSCGWVDVELLARDPSMAPPQLNTDVHRIREQFGRHGVLDPARVIERRHRPRQIRIGTGNISIAFL